MISFLNIGYMTLLGKGNRVSTPLLVSSRLAPAKVILSRSGFGQTRVMLTRWMKHGLTTFAVPGHDLLLNRTIYMDVESNLGPGDIMKETTDQLDELNPQGSDTSKTTYS